MFTVTADKVLPTTVRPILSWLIPLLLCGSDRVRVAGRQTRSLPLPVLFSRHANPSRNYGGQY